MIEWVREQEKMRMSKLIRAVFIFLGETKKQVEGEHVSFYFWKWSVIVMLHTMSSFAALYLLSAANQTRRETLRVMKNEILALCHEIAQSGYAKFQQYSDQTREINLETLGRGIRLAKMIGFPRREGRYHRSVCYWPICIRENDIEASWTIVWQLMGGNDFTGTTAYWKSILQNAR